MHRGTICDFATNSECVNSVCEAKITTQIEHATKKPRIIPNLHAQKSSNPQEQMQLKTFESRIQKTLEPLSTDATTNL